MTLAERVARRFRYGKPVIIVSGLPRSGTSMVMNMLARGKAVKVVSFLLTWLPETCDYRVVFMQRDLDEIIASQNQMLARRGEPAGAGDASTRKVYAEHLQQM